MTCRDGKGKLGNLTTVRFPFTRSKQESAAHGASERAQSSGAPPATRSFGVLLSQHFAAAVRVSKVGAELVEHLACIAFDGYPKITLR